MLIFKNTGTVAVAARITILWKNDIRFSSCRVSRLGIGLLWSRNEAAGQMSYPGMCRWAVDHTVYSWLLSHGPYLQTATWLLDSWLGPAFTVSSFLSQHPSLSLALFKSCMYLHFSPHLVFLGVYLITYASFSFHPLVTKLKDEFHRGKIKSLSVTTEQDLFLKFIFSAVSYLILFRMASYLIHCSGFSNVLVLLISENWIQEWHKQDAICEKKKTLLHFLIIPVA